MPKVEILSRSSFGEDARACPGRGKERKEARGIGSITHGCAPWSDTSTPRIRNVSAARCHTYPMPKAGGEMLHRCRRFPAALTAISDSPAISPARGTSGFEPFCRAENGSHREKLISTLGKTVFEFVKKKKEIDWVSKSHRHLTQKFAMV